MSDTDAQVPLPDLNAAQPPTGDDIAYHEDEQASRIAAEPLGEITGLVQDCFSHLVSTPHLVVRINESLYDAAHERIERLAKQSGFEGRLVILAEPEIETGDCRIEWADGGVVLERTAIEAKINELVGRYIASRNPA